MQSLKILHLEDDPLDAELMSSVLCAAGIVCEIRRVDTEAAFRSAIDRRDYDLIISDFSMPGFDGGRALALARQQTPETPFIFVSGTLDDEAAVDGLVQGATDYVLKHQFSKLVPAIRRAQRETEQRKEREAVEGQLLRTQRMESIGTLAGGIAHDLNNVFAPILMGVQVLKDAHPDAASQALLEILEASARRGANIVRQVLTFARGTAGERQPVQAGHLIAAMEKMLNQTFPKSIRIDCVVPRDLWIIIGNPTQLDQLLLNLCVNARDAMPDGGRLKIEAENIILDEHFARTHVEAAPGPHIMIEVQDSGSGIPANIIPRIFEPFFTTKELGKGTGLGLSTVMAIVRSHRGLVTVSCEAGKGTSFKVFLPAKDTTQTNAVSEQSTPFAAGKGELVLVVDDEAAVRDVTRLMLESYGYRVLTAKNGAEAMACYKRNAPEIRAVLLDMIMPVMDGRATFVALASIDPDVRVIATTGLADDTSTLTGTDGVRTVRAVLSKPYTTEALLATLQRVLSA